MFGARIATKRRNSKRQSSAANAPNQNHRSAHRCKLSTGPIRSRAKGQRVDPAAEPRFQFFPGAAVCGPVRERTVEVPTVPAFPSHAGLSVGQGHLLLSLPAMADSGGVRRVSRHPWKACPAFSPAATGEPRARARALLPSRNVDASKGRLRRRTGPFLERHPHT
jgi:hypothetical protein